MDGWAWLGPQEGKQREEKGMVWEETRGKVVLENVAGCQVVPWQISQTAEGLKSENLKVTN